ncbi:hypothetical protein [Lysinibacillus sp. G4S2]|uniref:hypothetical protein n=1 Tax=Lysinibacillus sp. G4S2 TaxID=3055859 RepID=UPI0025A267C0|nr:hypothetical protein [Lysinibacillus sp. G4S2]MDM5246432.1 hypothetical protein [Lysinibacillus sp. G4S2]
MYTKDQMIQLAYQLENNLDEITDSMDNLIQDNDSKEKLNYSRSKKRKGDEIEQILNCRIMEFRQGHSYHLPKEFVALWALLLADSTIENGEDGIEMKGILKGLKPTTNTRKTIPAAIIEKLRMGLQIAYVRAFKGENHDININELIDMQIQAIQENYLFNIEKKKKEKEIQQLIKDAFQTKFGRPNQYTVQASKEKHEELYPFGELTYEQQLEKMDELKEKIKRQLENW